LLEDSNSNSKEWKLIEKTVLQLGNEHKRSRRWGILFKTLTFVYLFALLIILKDGFSGESFTHADTYTALVDVSGVIAAGEKAGADNIVTGMRAAFNAEGTQAVVLRINSPGGSPVQAGYVYDEIKRLRVLHPNIPLYAVISDIGASGAYYIAAAADKIYADKASLVGSIGVIASGFGFVDTMKKLGVERRLYTSGKHKAFLDSFSDQKSDEVDFWQSVLNETHQQFINKVKEGRGERLTVAEDTFSGLIWNGEQALKMGLIDGLGSTGYVAREIVGTKDIVDFTPKPDAFEQISKTLGMAASTAMAKIMAAGNLSMH